MLSKPLLIVDDPFARCFATRLAGGSMISSAIDYVRRNISVKNDLCVAQSGLPSALHDRGAGVVSTLSVAVLRFTET
jgi:hypothetical protein